MEAYYECEQQFTQNLNERLVEILCNESGIWMQYRVRKMFGDDFKWENQTTKIFNTRITSLTGEA